jgi:D-amino-acid dehydrogenase
MPDVVVVGGGLLGSCVAYELIRHGLDVTLVERDDRGQATHAGAGILSPASSRYGNESDARFAYNAGDYYRALIPQIQEDGGGDTGYGQVAVMVVAGEGDSREGFDQARQEFLRFQDRDFAKPALQDLTAEEAKQHFPALGRVEGALIDANGARVDGKEFRSALHRAAIGRGLDVIYDGVDRVTISAGRVTGVVVRGRSLSCNSVVLAAGAWTSQIQESLGMQECVAPMRGQICHLGWNAGPTAGWAVVVGMRGHYILPRASGRVVVGATREKDSGLTTELTAGGCHEVLGEALRVAPGLAGASVLEWRVGLRPVSADGHPVLGQSPGLKGCFLATGHGAGGLLLGPWSAHLVAKELLAGKPEPELARYRPDRFAQAGAYSK